MKTPVQKRAQVLVLILFFGFWCFDTRTAGGQSAALTYDSIAYYYNSERYDKGLELSERILAKAEKDSAQNKLAHATALFHRGMFQCRLQDWAVGMKSVFAAEKRMTNAKMGDPFLRAQVALFCFIGCSNVPDSAHQQQRWLAEIKHLNKDAGADSNLINAFYFYGLALDKYWAQHYEASILLFEQAITLFENGGFTNERDLMKALYHLAGANSNLGRTDKERAILDEMIKRYEAAGKSRQWPLAQLHSQLSGIEREAGVYSNMEKYGRQALELTREQYGEAHPYYLEALYGLSGAYFSLLEYEKAQNVVRDCLKALREKGLENTQAFHAMEMDLASLLIDDKKFTESDQLFDHALKWFESNKEDPGSSALLNFAYLNLRIGNYAKALSLYEKGNPRGGQVDDPFIMSAKGAVLRMSGKFDEAEKCLKATLERPGSKTFHFGTKSLWFENQFGRCFLDQGKLPEAEAWFESVNEKMLRFIRINFPRFSDHEKEQFQHMIALNLDYFNSFCELRAESNPAILDHFYNNQLATKALLLNSSAKWKQRIKSSHDRKLLVKYTQWEEYRNRLSQLYQNNDSLARLAIDSIEHKCSLLEKDLSQRSEHFAELADKKVFTWRDVQASLKPGEAAIEMVRLAKYGVARLITDTSDPAKPIYPDLGLTDTIYYAALIVKPGIQHPEMVLLKNGNDLEKKYLYRYNNLIQTKANDPNSYGVYWKKIADRTKDCHRIYFSADGVFHQINLNTLYNPIAKKYLLEEKDIRLVTVTKDLLQIRKAETENKLAYLIGHPTYYNAPAEVSMSSGTSWRTPTLRSSPSFDGPQSLADLPATAKEVNKIYTQLQALGWEVQNLTEENASEESLKECYKPRLLHIATHGYFQTDSLKNPLLRSGLMLAGAGKTLSGQQTETGEDGILTAYEAMNLNLDNTDLVVLSACETGLGEIKNGEGVYGLQRAFKVAGAKSIIMSLWKVDDDATQELMVSFYKHWLGPNDNGRLNQSKPSSNTLRQAQGDKAPASNKRAAFLKAQKELKAKYPNPYFWGAFVLVGE